MKAHITDELAAELPENQIVWDDLDLGFGLRRQRRKAIFLVRYRQNRMRKSLTLGVHGQTSAAEARQKAQIILESVRSRAPRVAPWEIRRSKSGQTYFGEVAERYLHEFAKPRKKAKSVQADRRNLELHILPRIGNLKLSDIDRPVIIKLHAAMHETAVAANRCLALISHIFSLAEKWGLVAYGANPCRHVDRFIERERERYLSEEEFVRLGTALDIASRGYGVIERISPRFSVPRRTPEDWRALAAIRLLLFTGARAGEILSLRWSWIDWRLKIARLPDSKTGPKIVVLPEPAVQLLRPLKERVNTEYPANPFVLPGNRGSTHFQGLFNAWKRIRAVAQLEDLRIHDLRHVYASTAVSNGGSLYIVGRILGHRQQATTERYAHLALDPVQEVANRTAVTLANLLQPYRC